MYELFFWSGFCYRLNWLTNCVFVNNRDSLKSFNLHFDIMKIVLGFVVLQIGYVRLLSIVTDNVNDDVM